MTDFSIIGYGLFAIAAVLAVAGPLSVGFAAAVVLALTPFLRLPLQFGAGELGIRPEDVVIAILTLRCLLFHPLPPLQSDVRRFVNAYLVLLVFVALFTMFALATHPAKEISWYPHAKAIGVTAMGYVALCAIRKRGDFCHFAVGLQAGGVILAISALLAAKLADTMVVVETSAYDAQMVAAKGAVSSFALGWNSNVVGITCGGLLLAALPLVQRLRPVRTLLFRVATVVIIGTGLMMSYCRTAMIAVAVVLLLAPLYSGQRRGRGVAAYAFSVALLLCLAMALGIRPEAFRMSLSDNVNTGQRLEIWQASASTLLKWPIGYRVGVGDLAIANVWGKRLSAHNDWMDFALEIGLAGALWAAVTYLWLARLIKIASRLGIQAEAMQIFLFFLICSFSGQVFSFSKQPFVIMAVYLGLFNAVLPGNRAVSTVDSAAEARARLAWKTPVGSGTV